MDSPPTRTIQFLELQNIFPMTFSAGTGGESLHLVKTRTKNTQERIRRPPHEQNCSTGCWDRPALGKTKKKLRAKRGKKNVFFAIPKRKACPTNGSLPHEREPAPRTELLYRSGTWAK